MHGPDICAPSHVASLLACSERNDVFVPLGGGVVGVYGPEPSRPAVDFLHPDAGHRTVGVEVTCIACCSSGKGQAELLVGFSDGRASAWVECGSKIWVPSLVPWQVTSDTSQVTAIARIGNLIWTGSMSGTMRRWVEQTRDEFGEGVRPEQVQPDLSRPPEPPAFKVGGPAHGGAVRAIAQCESSSTAWSLGRDGALRVWSSASGRFRASPSLEGARPTSLATVRGHVWTSHHGGTLARWSGHGTLQLRVPPPHGSATSPIRAMHTIVDGRICLGRADGSLALVHGASGRESGESWPASAVRSPLLALASSPTTLYSRDARGEVTAWDGGPQRDTRDSCEDSPVHSPAKSLAPPPGTLRVHCVTWNVCGLPSPQVTSELASTLLAWCHPDFGAPDVVAVCLQEVEKLGARATALEQTGAGKRWEDTLVGTLGPAYRVAACAQMVGILTAVFTRASRMPESVAVGRVPTGLLGVGGNKGAVGVRILLGGVSLCVVGCHLAAHAAEVFRRNSDAAQIVSRLVFGPADEAGGSSKPRSASAGRRSGGGVYSSDVAIVLGDLNYRIGLSVAEAASCVRAGRVIDHGFPRLMGADQLRSEMGAGRVFPGFSEPRITFAPSYKFRPGTSKYDLGDETLGAEDKKARTPSFTDRILYRVAPKRFRVLPLAYFSDWRLCESDHKPVAALLHIT